MYALEAHGWFIPQHREQAGYAAHPTRRQGSAPEITRRAMAVRSPRDPRRNAWKRGAGPRRPGASLLRIALGDEDIGDLRHLLGTLRRDRGQDALESAMPHPRGQEGLTVRPLLDVPVALGLALRERPSRRSGGGS
jgi:hypothetical protein